MEKQLVRRDEVDQQTTWDLSSYYKNEEDYQASLLALRQAVDAFKDNYKGKLTTAETINAALRDYQLILITFSQLSAFNHLSAQADQTNQEVAKHNGDFMIQAASMQNDLVFFESELGYCDEALLRRAGQDDVSHQHYLDEVLRAKPHRLSAEVEAALSQFSQVFDAPYHTYLKSKLADLSFPEFTVKDKKYPQGFVLFENEWEYEVNTDIRRAAYQSFYEGLSAYQNTFASVYQTQVLREKAEATLRGFSSVFDYLLFDQAVTREMYDRQIDVIMEELAPAMRRYATLIKKLHHLDKMTYADLKLPIDPDFEPLITVAESEAKILEGLAVLGDDYQAMIKRAYAERWIDFPQNIGKSTGAFCNSTYGVHPYILISWTKRMREVFVLAHELGHAGHFYLSHQHQNILNSRPSLYFIEAPSTMNELIVANHMIAEAKEPRMKRWVYASMISRTYYHNFVTHLLEAAYQREVYRLIDAGQSISAATLNQLTLDVFRKFWGDTVEIDDYAGLTWMRQPHYYMGLYPYTYSAGLTIATNVSQKILAGELDIEDWKAVLKTGGTKDPMGLAAMVDVDLSTAEPLRVTVSAISAMIDEIIALSDQM